MIGLMIEENSGSWTVIRLMIKKENSMLTTEKGIDQKWSF